MYPGMWGAATTRAASSTPKQIGDLRHLPLIPEASAGDLVERRHQPHAPIAPVRIIRTVGEHHDPEMPALVDDAAPEPAAFPPTLVAGVGPQHQEQPQRGTGDLVGGDPNLQVGTVVPDPSDAADQPGEADEDEQSPEDRPRDYASKRGRVTPEAARAVVILHRDHMLTFVASSSVEKSGRRALAWLLLGDSSHTCSHLLPPGPGVALGESADILSIASTSRYGLDRFLPDAES